MPMNVDVCVNAIDALLQPLPTAEATAARKAGIKAIVQGLLAHIMANMTITILPGAVGVQTTVGLGAPTGPPAAPVPLAPGVGITIT